MPSNEPTRWFPSPIERQHSRDLAALDRRCELAEEEAASIARLEARANFEKMKTTLVRRQAEHIAPDGADDYAMISMASTMAIVNVITRHSRGR